MRKDTANWIALTDYDIETARHMLETERYLYVIFLCHLALEKMLKAHVAEVTQTLPIKTHDLIYLVKTSKLELSEIHLDFIGKRSFLKYTDLTDRTEKIRIFKRSFRLTQ